MADLRVNAERATSAERAAVDAVIRGRRGDGGGVVVREHERLVRAGTSRRRSRRHLLLPALQALQREIGWISPGGLDHVCELLQVAPAEAYGVATFYDLLRTEPPAGDGPTVHVCVDQACRLAGSLALLEERAASGDDVRGAPCLGRCERAPATFVQHRGGPEHGPADADSSAGPVDRRGAVHVPQHGDPSLRLLRRIGVVDPTSLGAYRDRGGYAALARAIEWGGDRVLDELAAAGLSGRGGAAFPTATKWRAVAEQPGHRRHVIANGDESEPGTFKDRLVMEQDPFAVVEALTLAGLVTGAEQGWIYVRGEYPLAADRLSAAIDAARAAGLLGDDVAGSGHRFDIELRRGGGAYVCGEETALFASIEGFRGEPRNKPPFPTTHGLFGEPTVVNNPETLLNVLDIVVDGASAYRRLGTEGSPGTRLFCLSGHVTLPGVYEVPFGTRLGELIELAGGPRGRLRAVLLGGAAGTFVDAAGLDLPLTLEDARAAGATLGSGAVTLFDDTVDFDDVVIRLAEFFRHESCGQCVPCRVGTVRQHEVLVEMHRRRKLTDTRRRLLDDVATVMADASICGLGHTAANAVRSAVELGLVGGRS